MSANSRPAFSGPDANRRSVATDVEAHAALLGSSTAMRRVTNQLRALAPLSRPVLLLGPRGSGKTLAARVLHAWSGRDPRRFVDAPVGLFADGLEHSQLLGHVRGAFTGAVTDISGVFERAHRGTLFLDEIGDASPLLQSALLPLIEARPFCPIGQERAMSFEIRLVFATNADLTDLVAKGAFRADLLDRIGCFVVQMPALRHHREDIPELAERALVRFTTKEDLPPKDLTRSDIDLLLAYDWPGNVRELEGAMEWFGVFGELPESIRPPRRKPDWNRLAEIMERHDDNVAGVADELGVSRQTVYRQLKELESAGRMGQGSDG